MRLLCVVLAFLCAAQPARADDSRPLTLFAAQAEGGAVELRWKVPPNVEASLIPVLVPPGTCTQHPQMRQWSNALGHWRSAIWDCEASLAGQSINLDWPSYNPGLATIARIQLAGEAERTILLQPGENEVHIAPSGAPEPVFTKFLQLGFEHIWEGIDHLLFVFGLILVARKWRRILVTVTGFTLAHSLTLAASSLDLIQLSPRAVEAVIALSIVFLAVEIVKGPRDTLTWRRPVAVAAAFGLLHGFGFASVLRETGLPQGNFLSALLAFNFGIEIGQVIFAALVFATLVLLGKILSEKAQAPLQKFFGYGLGIIASAWLIERVLSA